MKFGTLLKVVAAIVSIPALAHTAPPANDKFAKATVLNGTSGNVNSTNIEATFESTKYEPNRNGDLFGQNIQSTVWYAYTAPSDGFLEIIADAGNNAGGAMVVMPYRVLPSGSYTFFNLAPSTTHLDLVSNKKTLITPFTKGNTIKFQFDTDSNNGTALPGTFDFSYTFHTGAAFRLEGIPHPADRFISWRENEAAIEIVVARNRNTEGTVTVAYALVNGSGDVDTDLTSGGDDFSGTLTFAPGESRKTLSFPINDDADTESPETFTFTLSNPSAGNLIIDQETTFTLEDDDGAPANDNFADAVVVTGEAVTEAIGAGIATIEVNEPQNLSQTVWYRWTAPSDGIASITNNRSRSLSVFTGDSLIDLTQVRPVDAVNPPTYVFPGGKQGGGDFIVESGVTYQIVIAGYDSAIGATNLGIAHHGVNPMTPLISPSSFRFSNSEYSVLEKAGPVTVTIERRGNTTQATAVEFTTSLTASDPEDGLQYDPSPFATPDADYTVKTETVIFEAGETSKDVEVVIANEVKKEGTEHFNVRLSSGQVFSPVDSPAIATVLILEKASTETFFFQSGHGRFYIGALQPQATGGEGTISINLNSNGSFTGTLLLDGTKFPLRDSFPALTDQRNVSVQKVINIVRTGLANAVLTLNYTVDDNYDALLTGTVTDGTLNSTFTTYIPSFFGNFNIQKTLGKFTVILTPDTNVPVPIRVPGYLALEVKAKGEISLLGTLPDGTKVSGSGFLSFTKLYLDDYSSDYDAIFFIPLYKGTGHLSGKLHLTHPGDRAETPATGDGEGTVRWAHPALTKGTVLTAFGAAMEPYISRYTVPAGGLVLALTPPTAINVEISGGNLTADALAGTFGAKSVVTFTPTPATKPSLKFTASNGLFSGKYTPTTPSGSKALTFQGAVSRNRSTGTGNFLNGTTGGAVQISLPTAP